MWARLTDGTITGPVKYFNITKDEKKCENTLPLDWLNKYKVDDKMCAIFDRKNEPICTGYSGAGWLFLNPDNNRYYIHGLISLAPYNVQTKCATDSVLYTKISTYYDFIEGKYCIYIFLNICQYFMLKDFNVSYLRMK